MTEVQQHTHTHIHTYRRGRSYVIFSLKVPPSGLGQSAAVVAIIHSTPRLKEVRTLIKSLVLRTMSSGFITWQHPWPPTQPYYSNRHKYIHTPMASRNTHILLIYTVHDHLSVCLWTQSRNCLIRPTAMHSPLKKLITFITSTHWLYLPHESLYCHSQHASPGLQSVSVLSTLTWAALFFLSVWLALTDCQAFWSQISIYIYIWCYKMWLSIATLNKR